MQEYFFLYKYYICSQYFTHMKKWLAGVWLFALMLIVASFFWFNQFVYSLPTPVPMGYKPVPNGTKLNLPLPMKVDAAKPLFLHFFNPDCPCSRFNIKEFKALVKDHQKDMNFMVVLMTDKPYTAAAVQERFGITVPVIKDLNIANSCGVYSTPQAVVLTSDRELYYRGNYNRSRYCTDEKTSYAKMAVKNLLSNQEIRLESVAFKPYGCSVPNCTN